MSSPGLAGQCPMSWSGSCSGDQTTTSYAIPLASGATGCHWKTAILDTLELEGGLISSGAITTDARTGCASAVAAGCGVGDGSRGGIRVDFARDTAVATETEVAVALGDAVLVGNGVALGCKAAAVEDAVGVGWATEGVRVGVLPCCIATEAVEFHRTHQCLRPAVRTKDVAVGVADTERVTTGYRGVDLLDWPKVPSDLPAASATTAGVSVRIASG